MSDIDAAVGDYIRLEPDAGLTQEIRDLIAYQNLFLVVASEEIDEEDDPDGSRLRSFQLKTMSGECVYWDKSDNDSSIPLYRHEYTIDRFIAEVRKAGEAQ